MIHIHIYLTHSASSKGFQNLCDIRPLASGRGRTRQKGSFFLRHERITVFPENKLGSRMMASHPSTALNAQGGAVESPHSLEDDTVQLAVVMSRLSLCFHPTIPGYQF